MLFASWSKLKGRDGAPLRFLCPAHIGVLGTPECRFDFTRPMDLAQHNASMTLMMGARGLQKRGTSYRARRTLSTAVGKGR